MSIAFTVIGSIGAFYVLHRAEKLARDTPETEARPATALQPPIAPVAAPVAAFVWAACGCML